MSVPLSSSSSDRIERPLAGTRAGYDLFQRERARLVNQINESFEVVLEGSNQLNRKLEDAVAVGHEFAPIAGLWSQLDVIMRAAGIPDLAAQVKDEARRGAASTTVGAGSGDRALTPAPATPAREGARTPTTPGGLTDATPRAPDASTRASLRASMGLDGDEPNNKLIHHEDDLPPGVAPGSGFVYGRE